MQERLGKDVPKPAAFAPFYPAYSTMAGFLVVPRNPFYNAHTRMSATPMLIHVGTCDGYEKGERPCDGLVAMLAAAAREQVIVRYVEGATHAFDTQKIDREFSVNVVPSPKDAAEARVAVVSFFVKHLKP